MEDTKEGREAEGCNEGLTKSGRFINLPFLRLLGVFLLPEIVRLRDRLSPSPIKWVSVIISEIHFRWQMAQEGRRSPKRHFLLTCIFLKNMHVKS